MARKSKYIADEVVAFLGKRKGIKFSGKVITVDPRNDLGNRCWGRIDFLQNYNNYTVLVKTRR